MHRLIFLIFAFIFFAPSFCFAQTHTALPPQEIHLKDGSIIKGRLTGVSGDQYIIQTENLGEVRIKTTDLQGLSTPASSESNLTTRGNPPRQEVPRAGSSSLPPALQEMQQKMMADPEIMAAIQELSNDPEIQALAKDPEIIKSTMSMDPEQIQNNPAAQKLLNNPKMQQVMQKVAEKMMAAPAGQSK